MEFRKSFPINNGSLKLGATIAIVSTLAACETTNAVEAPRETLDVVSFDFTPETFSPASSADMTIILVRPQYASQFAYSGIEPYQSFADNMGNDFEELLTARGFNVQGPYESYDEIVYSVKDSADLILEVDIDINQNEQGLIRRPVQNLMSSLIVVTAGAQPQTYYRLNGNIGLSGKLNFQAYEPKTREKMWVKSVNIEPVSVPVNSQNAYTYLGLTQKTYYKDPGIHNPTFRALEEVYENSMQQAYVYLEPQELQSLRPQIQSIKNNKRY